MESADYQKGKKLYIVACIFTLLCVVFLVIYHLLDITFVTGAPSCFVSAYWHLYCPGCGGTRALEALLHGRVLTSLLSHPVVIYLATIYLSYFLCASYTFLIKRDGQLYYRFHAWTLLGMPIIVLVNCVVRNLLLVVFHYDFLGTCLTYWIG